MTNTINERALAVMGNPQWQQNWALDGRSIYGEILELANGNVWMCQQAFSAEQYEALTVPEGFIKCGAARAIHDAAFFRRRPTADMDGPLDTMAVDGRTFSRVAIPGQVDSHFDYAADGLLALEVNKHHSVMFSKGRTFEVLRRDDGLDYVPIFNDVAVNMLGMPISASERVLPVGWAVRTVTLKEDLFVDIPCPAKVCFFSDGSSFQGPLTLNL